MSVCNFDIAEMPDGKFFATCRVCGRTATAGSRTVVAACKASAAYAETARRISTALAGGGGPGTELKNLLAEWLGVVSEPGCLCDQTARKMDLLGAEWCEGPGMPEILNTMRDEHAKRWANGRIRLPWSDLAARQLVSLACRRARAKTLA